MELDEVRDEEAALGGETLEPPSQARLGGLRQRPAAATQGNHVMGPAAQALGPASAVASGAVLSARLLSARSVDKGGGVDEDDPVEG